MTSRIDEMVALNTAHQAPRTTTLYRMLDGDGRLLYVGISGDPGRRFEAHARDKAWWGDVATIAVEHHPTRSEALVAEAEAICVHQPPYNDIGIPVPPRRYAARFARLPCGLCADGAPEHVCA